MPTALTLDVARRRRKAMFQEPDEGFTLIELLVVVIIIGILAAIAIPVYLGVQNNAKDSSLQSDVGNFKSAVLSAQATQGTAYATTKQSYTTSAGLATALPGGTATWGASTKSLTFYPSSTGFCLLGISSVTGSSFAVTDQAGVQKGSCTTAGAYSSTVVSTAP
ncbi:type II secretion system protein [Frondihabitans australicus]|uniref:MSHA pilin protein MshA n=1 Tax=Frondihabitans australicus TaxID=386892 RepID=A0A495IID6_9MICO|nr:type II secretion system protein [Frondihabitans australicus]RKR75529.1 MSHA pilin protein MshA [Frondihabitans australicus]